MTRPARLVRRGLVFLIGRAVHAFAYVADPTKRSTGFMLSFLPSLRKYRGRSQAEIAHCTDN